MAALQDEDIDILESEEPAAEEELFIGDGDELPVDEFVYEEDADNLVSAFQAHEEGKAFLRKFSSEVRAKYDRTRDSTEEYRQRIADDHKIFSGELPPKAFPFKDCANVHVPIMLENISRLTARFYGEIFGDMTNVFGVMPVGPDDEEEASILTMHGNWQLREAIRDFDRQMDRAILAYVMWGDTTARSYYDEGRRSNRHEVLTPDEFFVPYVFVTTQPDYSDVPFHFHLLHYYRHDIQGMADRWVGIEEVLERKPPGWSSTESPTELRESVGETQAIEVPSDDDSAPYKLFIYEGWELLPNQAQDRFVQAVVDTTTGHILKLCIHEEEDWRDQIRYEQQLAEAAQWQQAVQQYDSAYDQSLMLERQVRDQMATDTMTPPEMKAQRLAELDAGSRMMPPRPPRPSWMPEDGSIEPPKAKKVPIRLYTHGVCIENMVGSLGLSYGRMQSDFNRAANTALNQFTDSATLSNCWTIITPTSVEFDGGFGFSPGRHNKVKGISGLELKNNVIELKPEPANPQLLQVVDKMFSYGQSSMQAPNVLSGEPGKSGETYKGISARIEQATKQLSVSARKFCRGPLKQILLNNAKLNSIYLDERELISVADHKIGMVRNIEVSRKMYRRNYNVTISADLRFASQAQKVAEADEVAMMMQAFPQLQNNIAFAHSALRKALEARERFDLVPMLGPPPPMPQTPFGLPPQVVAQMLGMAPPVPPPGPGNAPPAQGAAPSDPTKKGPEQR